MTKLRSMTPTRWVVVGLAILIATSILVAVTGGWLDRASASSIRRVHVYPDGFTTYVVNDDALCPEHPNGVLAGWIGWDIEKDSADVHTHLWTFGPWSGLYCSNHKLIWGIDWGGEPGHATGPLTTWRYDEGYTHISGQDNRGPSQYRSWKAHFHAAAGTFSRDCYPHLTTTIKVDQVIRHGRGYGC